MLSLRTRPLLGLACLLACVGCSDDPSGGPMPQPEGDSGTDAALESGTPIDSGHEASVEAGGDASNDSPPGPPSIDPPGDLSVDEDHTLSLQVEVHPNATSEVRVMAAGLPPGARWKEDARRLVFTPDFIQGGQSWKVTLTASSAHGATSETFTLTVNDTIQPPWPTVAKTEVGSGYKSLWLDQKTDAYLDSPGHAGRVIQARVIVPDEASDSNRVPVRVYLHGFGGGPYDGTSSGGQFRIYPHDPMNSYWWGYAASLPGAPPSGTVPNYTQRRVLHLLEWVLRQQTGADPNRVYVTGGSMGGAGAATLGFTYARHFAFVEATIGQTVPRNHRPSRLQQLSGLWGTPEANLPDGTALENGQPLGVWDRQDLCRLLRDSAEARTLHIHTKHGKDDPTIHFGAVTLPSPITQRSFLDALRDHRVGHYVVWDEGGHGSPDPLMPSGWWDDGWSRLSDAKAFLRSDLPFPAFSMASHDWNPGDGSGNGKQPWSNDTGYAGKEGVAGDTGWSGDIAGARNRFLRWDSTGIKDTTTQLVVPLYAVDGQGGDAPKAGYPTTEDRIDRSLPFEVDVTIRRSRGFVCRKGETIAWAFGGASGKAIAGDDGEVTIEKLKLGLTPIDLVLTK